MVYQRRRIAWSHTEDRRPDREYLVVRFHRDKSFVRASGKRPDILEKAWHERETGAFLNLVKNCCEACLLLDVEGFWTRAMKSLDHLVACGFVDSDDLAAVEVCPDAQGLVEALPFPSTTVGEPHALT